jgi:phage-related protein
MQRPEKTPIRFYRTTTGTEPVLDWMRALERAERRLIGHDLARIQYGWPIGMPLCRSLGDGLWEMRRSLAGNRIARLIFFFHEQELGLVHAFIKKTRKTPPSDIALAKRRRKEMIS